jgi:hypothetical protein
MRNLGWSLIFGALSILAGCSPGSQTPTNTSPPSTLTLTTSSLPAGTVGAAYSSSVTASGGATPYTYSAANLPAGLSINGSTGAIIGTPALSSIGTTSVTIKVTDSTQPSPQSATANLSIKISPATLAITTASLPAGTVASPYPSTTLQASGGVSPYTWALASGSSLPAGLSLSTGGVISGTPATAGSYSLTFVVTDSLTPPDTAQATLALTISGAPSAPSAPPLALTTTTLPNATLNTAYSATLTATGGVTPYTFSLANSTSLPAGLTLSSAGVISGTPTKAGSTSFSIQVVDSSTPTPLSQTGNLSMDTSRSQLQTCGTPTSPPLRSIPTRQLLSAR